MKHFEQLTPGGRHAEGYFFRKNKKDWVCVSLFAYHTKYEYCLEKISIEEALKSLDDNIETIEKEEEKCFEQSEGLND